MSSIPLVSVMDGDGRVIYTRNKTQLQGVSCNCWGRDFFFFSIIARVGGYRRGGVGTLFCDCEVRSCLRLKPTQRDQSGDWES